MKTRFCILFLLLTVPAFGQVSYWFQGWERKPDAAQAQAYFMLPGTNVTFTYTNNRVVINSTGGGGAVTNTGTNCFTFSAVSPVVVLLSGSGCSNVEYSLIGPLTNWAKYQTNSFDSAGVGTAAAQAATNGMTTIVYSNPATFYPASNPSNFLVGITNLLIAGSNITFITNLAGAITISATDTVGSAGSAIITNVFTTNLTTILQSNSVIVDVDGRLILGTNGATTTLTPDARTGPAKLSVYGDLALNRIGASGASSTFLYTIRSNFYTVTTAGDGALVISNTTGPNYIALAGVNAAARQMGMGLKNPNNLYSWGIDLSDNGSTNWFLYDLRANALAFMVDFSQHLGVKTNNPIFDLDVRGDANVSGVYRVKGIPIWSNTISAGTNIVLTTNVANISIHASGNWATNTYQGITNALHFIPATNNSGPWYVESTTNTVHTNSGAGAVKVIGSGSGTAMVITGGGNGGFLTKGQLMGFGSTGLKSWLFSDSSQLGSPTANVCMFGDSTADAVLAELDSGDRSLVGDQRRSIVQFGKDLYTTVGSDIVFFPDTQVNTITFQMNDNGGTAIGSSAHLITPPVDGLWVIGASSLDNDLINTDGAGSLFAGANVITPLYITDDVPGITTNLITIAGPSIYRSATFSNGIIVKATTVLYTNAFGAMALTNTGSHLTLAAANTYTTVTNWDYLATNRFTGMPPLLADGSLTNVNAGMYRLSFSLSCFGAVGDGIEADVALNGVPSEFCAAHSASGTVSKNTCLGGVTVMYLAANTRISLMVKNVNSTTMTITHAQVTVGTP